jgi:biotin carboxylase
MRRCLDEAGLGRLWHAVVWDEASLEAAAAAAPLPCIVKPRQGVASEEVKLAMDRREVTEHCKRVWAAEPEKPMLLEEFVAGPLCTLETLGDGKSLQVIGSYRTVLSPSPYFIELEGTFGSGLAPDDEAAVLEQLRAIGVGFGACHTELILSASGPRIVEVNYRFPGDQREFLMQEVLGIPLFERLLSIHLGEPLEPVPRSQRTGMIRAFTASEPGVLASVPSAFTRAEPTASLTYTPIRNVGDVVNVTHSNRDYLGFLRASGADINAVKDALDQAAHALHWDIQPSDAGFVEAQ